ncbi:MAG: T9SS type A sorting domain-containing protein [Bacteroidota bacterium]
MRKNILIIILIFYVKYGFGQYKTQLTPSVKDPEVWKLVTEGVNYLSGAKGYEKDYELAFSLFEQAALENEPIAQFFLGKMFEQGLGVEKNLQKAIKYFQISADNDNNASLLELGKVYKNGNGVKQNFKNAVRYFKKSSDKNSSKGQYAMGYMYFKGLGTDQDYNKAFHLFSKGEKDDFAPSLFMLGICYENGYYVETDFDKAVKYYELAANQDYKQAKVRLEELSDADNLKSAKQHDNKLHNSFNDLGLIPDSFTKIIERQNEDINIDGEWEGELIVYDWSGKEAEEIQKIQISVKQNNYNIKTNWDSDLTHTASNGFVQGNKVYFNNLNLVSRSSIGEFIKKNIGNVTLSLTTTDSVAFLSGNIISTIPSIKEPGAPGYIVLKQSIKTKQINQTYSFNSVDLINTNNANEGINFNIYPNPFENRIKVDFKVKEAGNVNISIYNGSGKIISQEYKSQYYFPGSYSKELLLQVLPGIYFVEIQYNGLRLTRKLIKN